MKPASEYDIRYGHGLLAEDSASWPPYIVVTTPTALKTARPFLSREPAAIVINRSNDRAHLEKTAAEAPDGAGLVVGLGGGRAIDHAKLVAARKGARLVQVPTIVSTGAIIHSVCPNWEGFVLNHADVVAAEVDAEYVLVDYDLVLQAEERLNTAGLGDVLCGYAGMCEWRYKAARGAAPPFDEAAAAKTLRHHEEIVVGFPRTLGPDGRLTPASVRFIMRAVQDRDDMMLRHPSAPPSEHHFPCALDLANRSYWIHGEECALGAVIVAWHTGQSPEVLIERLDTCRVRFRPRDMQISRAQLRLGLEELPRWLADKPHGRDIDSVMRREPVTGQRFEELWAWLGTV